MAANDLVLRVSANVGRLIANLQKAGAAVKRFSGQTTAAGAAATQASAAIASTGKSATSVSKITTSSQVAQNSLNKMAAASTRVASALKPVSAAVNQFGNRFKKFAADTSFGREAIQAYGVTAAALSAKVKQGEAALKKLSASMKRAGASAVAAGTQLKSMATSAVQSAAKTKAAQMSIKGFNAVSTKLTGALNRAKASFTEFGAKISAMGAKVGITRANLSKFGNGFISLAAKAKSSGGAILKAGMNAIKTNPMYLKLITSLKGAGAAFVSLGAKAKAAGAAMKAGGMAAMMAGGVILAALSPIIATGAKFQQSMADSFAVIGDSKDIDKGVSNMTRLEDTAKNLGKTTEFTATQVGQAFKFMGQAGMNTNEIIKATPSVLALATAGSMDLARASDLATDMMTAFGLEAGDMGRIVDTMTAASLASNMTLEQMGESLKYVAGVAKGFGIPLEEISAALGTLGSAGIKGSQAGTSLRMSLIKLNEVTDKGTAILQSYGLTYAQIDPSIVGLQGSLEALARAGVTTQDIFAMFGARAGTSMSLLMDNMDKFGEISDEVMNGFGKAASVQADKLATLGGEFKLFVSAVQGLSLSVFESVADDLANMVKFFRELAGSAEAWTQRNQGLTASITKMVGGLGSFLLIAGAMSMAIGAASSIFGTLVGTIAKIGVVLKPVGIAITTFLAGLTAVKALIAALVAVIAGVLIATLISARTMFDNVARAIGTLYDATIGKFIEGFIEGFSRLGQELGPVMDAAGAAFEQIGQAIEYVAGVVSDMLGDSFKNLGKTIADIGLDILVGTFELVRQGATAVAEMITSVVDTFIFYGKKLGLVSEDTETFAEQQKRLKDEFKALEPEIQKQIDGFDKMQDKVKEQGTELGILVDTLSDTTEASSAEMQQASRLAEKYGDINNAIQENKQAIEGQIQAHEAMLANGNLTAAQRQQYERQLKTLNDQLRTLKATEDQYNESLKNENNMLTASATSIQAVTDKRAKEAEQLEKTKAALSAHQDNLSKLAELEKEMAGDQTLANKYDERIRVIEEEQEARRVLLEKMREQFVIELEHAKAKETINQKEIDRLNKVIERTDAAIEKNDEYAQSQIDGVNDARAADQKAFENQQKIDAANRRGDKVEAARLQAQAEFDEKKKKIDELYDLEDAEQAAAHATAMANLRAERDAKIEAAKQAGNEANVQDQAQQQDNRADKAREQIKHEQAIFGEKAKQARTVQTLLQLEQARMAIEDKRFQRLKDAQDKAVQAENSVAAIREKLEKETDPKERQRLQKLLNERESDLAFERGRADRLAADAGVEIQQEKLDQLESQKAKIQQTLDDILALKAGLQTRLDEFVAVFGDAGGRMATAIYDGGGGDSGFAAKFVGSREQINAALNAWTPSVQNWADGFALIFENLATAIEQDLQRIVAAVNQANAATSSSGGYSNTTFISNNFGGGAGAGGGGPARP